MIIRRMPAARADSNASTKIFWFTPLLLAVACSGSEDIDFFEPSGSGGSATGGSAGSDTGGTATGGTATGGTSGEGTGGSGSEATGGTGAETGGTGADGGTGPTGGTNQGGDAGGGAGPTGGSAGDSMGGTAGTGMSGAGMGGASMGGADMGGAGMGGAGMGGAGMGGKGGKGGCVPTIPSAELCDGVDNNCMNGPDEGSACPDNCTGATLDGHYYTFCSFENASGSGTRQRTWVQAQDFCSTRNMALVAIESAGENDFVRAWITRMMLEDQVWMGANDRDPAIGLGNEGEWIWNSGSTAVQFWEGNENGSPVMNRYEDWAAGEPNNESNEDCGALSSNHEYHWDDRACSNMYANFVCEATIPVARN
jgi:lectin-like protein